MQLAMLAWVTERVSAVTHSQTIDGSRAPSRLVMVASTIARSALGGHLSALPCQRLGADTADEGGIRVSVEI